MRERAKTAGATFLKAIRLPPRAGIADVLTHGPGAAYAPVARRGGFCRGEIDNCGLREAFLRGRARGGMGGGRTGGYGRARQPVWVRVARCHSIVRANPSSNVTIGR